MKDYRKKASMALKDLDAELQFRLDEIIAELALPYREKVQVRLLEHGLRLWKDQVTVSLKHTLTYMLVHPRHSRNHSPTRPLCHSYHMGHGRGI